jgi:ergothioneine biosynthesis protein EgtB
MEISLEKSTDLVTRYQNVRSQTVKLCQPLATEDFVVQPVEYVSPPKWHLAHTTWFFETFVLQKFQPHYQLFHPDFGFLFNSYYESVGDRVIRADRGNITRPVVEDIFDYRRHVDQAMEQLMIDPTTMSSELITTVELGFHHEQQHQELLVTDLKFILGHNPTFPAYFKQAKPPVSTESIPAKFLEVDEGLYPIGYKGDGFCFDNELGSHQTFLPSFLIMNRLVTNKEYMEFIETGGYKHFAHWMMEGWEWVKSENISAPLYWHKYRGEWFHYDLYGFNKVNPEAPVTHISFYEADAYARWKGYRLPTEFEWETACNMYQPTIPASAQWMDHGNFLPSVGNDTDYQFYGDTWEWTGSAYRPYPYFQKKEGALGEYNGKFMVNQMVLRGGSCATPSSHIRSTYRNFFHPHLRWQFTGIRLATYQ